MSDFTGKRIIVTGAASGIGAALARQITDSGGEVIGVDLRTSSEVTHTIDLSDLGRLPDVIERLDGSFDGLANVAGVPGTASVDLIGRVNLFGTRIFTEAIAARLEPGATIACVSSISADRCDWSDLDLLRMAVSEDAAALADRAVDGTDAYQITKAALNLLVAQWAEAYAPQGIRVNAISPGPVETPILQDFETSMGKDRIDAAASIVGRHAHPEEIASGCAFLLSDASSWINGQIIKADGGLHSRRMAQKLKEAL